MVKYVCESVGVCVCRKERVCVCVSLCKSAEVPFGLQRSSLYSGMCVRLWGVCVCMSERERECVFV